jgi:hypothetical protein
MRGAGNSWSLVLVQVNEMCQKMYIKQISPQIESKKMKAVKNGNQEDKMPQMSVRTPC